MQENETDRRTNPQVALGAIPVSSGIVGRNVMGLWVCEIDVKNPPRLYVDDVTRGLFGFTCARSPEEAHRFWHDRIVPEHAGKVAVTLAEMVDGVHSEVQYRWRHPDGVVRHIRCDGVRNFAYTAGVRVEGRIRDVTDIVHSSLAGDRTIHMLLDGLTCEYHTIWLVDANQSLHFFRSSGQMSLRAAVQLGFDNPNYTSAMRKYIEEFVHPDDRARVLQDICFEKLWNTLSVGGVHVCTFRRCNAEGGFDYHQICFAKAVAQDGSINFAMGIRNADATIRKELETQRNLEEALSMAQAANRAKTVFLNGMSHDIRTPMNAIIGFTGLAVSHLDDPALVRDYLAKIGVASNHLLSLINDVLDMSRIESGKMTLAEHEVNLAEIVRALCDIVQADVRARRQEFSVDVTGVTDEEVVCDRLRLSQLLLNVLSNAVKFTPSGGAVSLRVSQKDVRADGRSAYEFRVRDTGVGMSEDFLKTIFEPFVRARSATISGVEGTGLGMAISKSIVDMMGGTIDIASAEGKGTEVVVTVDLRLARDRRVPVPAPVSSGFLGGRRILLVEDNDVNREIAATVLRDAGCTVVEAVNGQEAVEKSREPFDAILMDIQMPVMDGYAATRAIRARPDGKDVPIIALSANAFAEDRAASLAAGMNAHIAKPVRLHELLETFGRWL